MGKVSFRPGSSSMVWLVVLLILLAIARIVSVYPVIGQTYDEPAHLACGMQWLVDGQYRYEATHPPLARVAAALGPYLAGARFHNNPSMWVEGNLILHDEGNYDRNLRLARLGVLPFFVLACVFVWLGARILFGDAVAIASVLLFTTLPPVLGHAGIVGNDMAVTAMISATIYAFAAWLIRPGPVQTVGLGVAFGLALISKFSVIVFLPVSVLAVAVLWWLQTRQQAASVEPGFRVRSLRLAGALLLAWVVIWAGYHFSVSKVQSNNPTDARITGFFASHEQLRQIRDTIETAPIPGGELLRGLGSVVIHNAAGHAAYLMGEYRMHGWWYYFPVALALKTPIAFLLLAAFGVAALFGFHGSQQTRLRFIPAAIAGAILTVSLFSSINIGVRYILPIYPVLAILGGVGVSALFKSTKFRFGGGLLAVSLLAWQIYSGVHAHPDYLAYFNEIAASEPERYLVDSDLDWGQDLPRLSAELKHRGISEVSLSYHGTADLNKHGLPLVHPIVPFQRTTGWIAISLYNLKLRSLILGQEAGRSIPAFSWLEAYRPVATIGKSIRLYYVPVTAGLK
jgi:hypothetical protein